MGRRKYSQFQKKYLIRKATIDAELMHDHGKYDFFCCLFSAYNLAIYNDNCVPDNFSLEIYLGHYIRITISQNYCLHVKPPTYLLLTRQLCPPLDIIRTLRILPIVFGSSLHFPLITTKRDHCVPLKLIVMATLAVGIVEV